MDPVLNSPELRSNVQRLMHCLDSRLLLVTCDRRDHFQYAVYRGEGSGDLGPLHMTIWNTIIEPVMCKAHTGDAYCIAAASANTELLALFV